ncbi:MAG: hypothetical protein RL748_2017 [Pseudomonadota bacterium]|jgi:hypothetical protein
MAVHLFGIRHHGPGCARSLAQALAALQPDLILIEGPPEADDLLPLAIKADMQPPVAMLIYAPAMPQHAVYYPFAEFSPEWQAICYGQQHGVPTRFIDLPQAHQIAEAMSVQAAADALADVVTEIGPDPGSEPESVAQADPASELQTKPQAGPPSDSSNLEGAQRHPSGDALGWLAQAAGFADSDTWWDHLVEQRQDSLELFAAIEEMMTVARQDLAETLSLREARREASMRQQIRLGIKQGYQTIAVVCGAWHVPALRNLPSAKADADLLKNLPKAKVAATWTPWTYGRLALDSGYGAGISAPGWYQHLWRTPQKAALHWLIDCANLLRKHDLDASSSNVIEALRLADTLASLRERSRPGLDELLTALQSTLFGHTDAPLKLIERELLVKDRLGQIPADCPLLPLLQDVKQLQKSCRLPARLEHSELELDLRQASHLEKSILLHRLAMLGVDWGRTRRVSGKSGSFHEHWDLAWKPEFDLSLIEANVWGATLEAAVNAWLCHQAVQVQHLPRLTELVEKMLLADAREAVPVVMQAMQALAAHTHDAGLLLQALAPLANVLRYGNTRGTDTASVAQVLDGLITRACIALPLAAHGINTEAAQTLLKQINQADGALRLLQNESYLAQWLDALARCTGSNVHALVAGRAVRLLIEHEAWQVEQTAQALALACSNPIKPLETAEWLEGFLQGSGLLLVMNDALWQILHNWVASLNDTVFTELLPLLRRTFATFAAGERRQLAQRVGQGAIQLGPKNAATHEVHPQRAALVLPILRQIFGAHNDANPNANTSASASASASSNHSQEQA